MSTKPVGNGHDPDLRDEVEKARDLVAKMPNTREVAEHAYVDAHLAVVGMQRQGTLIIEIHNATKAQGKVLAEIQTTLGPIAAEASRANNLAEARIGALDNKINDGVNLVLRAMSAKIDPVLARLVQLEAEQEEMKKRSPDDSIVDAVESLPEDLASRILESAAKKNAVVAQKDAEIANLETRLAAIEREKHKESIRAQAVAEEQARVEKAAAKEEQKLEKRSRDRHATIKTLGVLLVIAGTLYGAFQVIAPHIK